MQRLYILYKNRENGSLSAIVTCSKMTFSLLTSIMFFFYYHTGTLIHFYVKLWVEICCSLPTEDHLSQKQQMQILRQMNSLIQLVRNAANYDKNYTKSQELISYFQCLIAELRALATLLGPYGMKYLGDRMLHQISNQMGEVKVEMTVLTHASTKYVKIHFTVILYWHRY